MGDEREEIARIIDHEGYWERLDSCNHALATVSMTDEQRRALTAVRDDELRGTASSLAKADAILARAQAPAPGEAVAWRTCGMSGDRWTPWVMCSEEMAKRWMADPSFKNGRRKVEALGVIAAPGEAVPDGLVEVAQAVVDALTQVETEKGVMWFVNSDDPEILCCALLDAVNAARGKTP